MIELPEPADIWEFHDAGHWIAVTTNPVINSHGECVMGRGIALQAKLRFPDLPKEVAALINVNGNVVNVIPHRRMITFPTKTHWRLMSDIVLIQESCRRARSTLTMLDIPKLYMGRPGCGNGGLSWTRVKPIIAPLLDDRFVIVNR